MEKKKNRSVWIAIIIILFIVLGGFIYGRYYFVFGEGVKAGELNYVVYKGVVFKTYEGKMVQSGFGGGKPGAIQSYEFQFSVEDKRIAERLMHAGGKNVELHYKEYFASLPWRGYSKYVVDSIIAIRDKTGVEYPAE